MTRPFKVIVEKNEEIRFRDGTVTYGDVYRPLDSEKVPTIVVRTPYDKEAPLTGSAAMGGQYLKIAERGYAVVVQNCRGRFSSAGEWYPFADETNDGYDAVSWVTRQPWSNSATALYGASYYGATAMLGARSNPPGLKALVSIFTTDEYYETWCYHGGAFQLGFLGTWGAMMAQNRVSRPDSQLPEAIKQQYREAMLEAIPRLRHRPIAAMPGISIPGVGPWWRDWVTHTENDAYWRRWRVADSHAVINAAGLHVAGMFDIFLAGNIRNFIGMKQAVNAPQKLVLGPWGHGGFLNREMGALDFGQTGAVVTSGVGQVIMAWLDRHLLGKPVDTGAPVRYFLMGANRWVDASDWPPPDAIVQRWFIHSDGGANSLRGNGVLSRQGPTSGEPSDLFVYNSDRPVPTCGGNTLMTEIHAPGPWDQREVEARDDVLVYTSEPLAHDMAVVGPVRFHLWATTDGPDTDWTAKLVDVHPDGTAVGLCDGIIRARYRHGTDRQVLLTPGRPYDYTIDLVATANVFKAGHRLRVEISSSNFPRFDRNTNTGGRIPEEATGKLGIQRVHHTPSMPSHLALHIVLH